MLDRVGQAVLGGMPQPGPARLPRAYTLGRRGGGTLRPRQPTGGRTGTRLLVPRPPHAPGDIIGRAFELSAVKHLLLEPHIRLVTVAGPAGIGKTRLVLALAEDDDLLAPFADGATFVDLAQVERATDVLPGIA